MEAILERPQPKCRAFAPAHRRMTSRRPAGPAGGRPLLRSTPLRRAALNIAEFRTDFAAAAAAAAAA